MFFVENLGYCCHVITKHVCCAKTNFLAVDGLHVFTVILKNHESCLSEHDNYFNFYNISLYESIRK